MSSRPPFNLKLTKQNLTIQKIALENLIQEAEKYRTPWMFPMELTQLRFFLTTKTITTNNLKERLGQQKDTFWASYVDSNYALADLNLEDKMAAEQQLDNHWGEIQGEATISLATNLLRQLERRLVELDCQKAVLRQIVSFSRRRATNDNCPTHGTTGLTPIYNQFQSQQQIVAPNVAFPVAPLPPINELVSWPTHHTPTTQGDMNL